MARLLIADSAGDELWEVGDPDSPGTAILLGTFPSGLFTPTAMTSLVTSSVYVGSNLAPIFHLGTQSVDRIYKGTDRVF